MNTITDGCFPAILLNARAECEKPEEAEQSEERFKNEFMSALGLSEEDENYEALLKQVDTFSLGKKSKKVIQMIKKEQTAKVKSESLNSLENGEDLGDTPSTLRKAFKRVPDPKKNRRMSLLSLSKEGHYTYVRFIKRDEWTDRAIHKSVCTALLS